MPFGKRIKSQMTALVKGGEIQKNTGGLILAMRLQLTPQLNDHGNPIE